MNVRHTSGEKTETFRVEPEVSDDDQDRDHDILIVQGKSLVWSFGMHLGK
jgi:hypothetical protein